MNPHTNHLIDGEEFAKLIKEQKADMFEPVPKGLRKSAEKLLDGKSETTVPRGHELDKWADRLRQKLKPNK